MPLLKELFFFPATLSVTLLSWPVLTLARLVPFLTILVQRMLLFCISSSCILLTFGFTSSSDDYHSLIGSWALVMVLYIVLGFVIHPYQDVFPSSDKEVLFLKSVRTTSFWGLVVATSIFVFESLAITLDHTFYSALVSLIGYLFFTIALTPINGSHSSLFDPDKLEKDHV